MIQENSCDSQRFHVNTKTQPTTAQEEKQQIIPRQTETWVNSPSFLWESESIWTSNKKIFDVSSNDSESKKEISTNYTEVSLDILHQLEEKISTWERMKTVLLQVLKFKQILPRKIKMDTIKEPLHGKDLLQESEVQLTKFVKKKDFQQNPKH